MKLVKSSFSKKSLDRLNNKNSDYLLIFLKYKEDYLFLEYRKKIFPIILNVDLMGMVEEHLTQTKIYLKKVFRIEPKIFTFSWHQSLNPIRKGTFHCVLVDLTKEEFYNIRDLFIKISKFEIESKRNSNYFFNILSENL